ncbi:MAG: helix-turn-helix transcriptional regulator [Clostridia bacterium]|nr:helix-turn-helix transcriptional regulator [Clostridia bacterium]
MRLTDISFFKQFNLDTSYNFEGHSHNTYEANIIFSGNMEVSVEGNVIKLSPGDMLLWPPGLFHSNRVGTVGTVNFVSIHFDFEEGLFADNQAVFHHLSPENLMLAKIMAKEAEKNSFTGDTPVRSLLEYLVLICNSNSKAPDYSNDSSAIVYRRVMELMSGNPDKILTIDDMAKSCGVCATTVKNAFKHHSGKSIKKYYCELKLEAAKNMLLDGMSAGEVAFALGFSSPSYFSQFFKRTGKISTKEFLRSYK